MAPVYTDCNSANDQNQLTMNIMRKVAERHNLVCLLSEKPFEGVNGSGKHNNWSIATDRGVNLLSPGKTPAQNAQFLLFLAAFVSAVDDYQDLLRCSVAYAGNDHRLGGNEAPPAIISIFLGTELQGVIDSVINDTSCGPMTVRPIKIGIDTMPFIPRDNTDRNRTSPIAFTGNKFEFRMPGSSQSIAGPTTVLNTIVADKLRTYADALEPADPAELTTALHDLVKKEFTEHSRIIFNGNGYDSAWVREAKRRGLGNRATTVEALSCYLDRKNVELMEREGVMSKEEMAAREEVESENYCNIITIEANTLLDMVRREIIPAVSAFQGTLCRTLLDKKSVLGESAIAVEKEECEKLSSDNERLMELTRKLTAALEHVSSDRSAASYAWFHYGILSLMEEMRAAVNDAERLVPASYWPYPTYRQLLFSV